MKISKKLLIFSLVTFLTANPLVVGASMEEDSKESISTEIEVINEEQKQIAEYIKYAGKIVDVMKDDKTHSIFVKDKEDDPMNGAIYHINDEVIILDAKTKEIVKEVDFEKGMKVSTYIHKNTPVTLSIPSQSVPNVIVINEGEDSGFINVSKFDENLVNKENTLKIILSDETIIINREGEEIGKEDILNKDLIVFYSQATKSIPAQALAEKIILMDKKESISYEDEVEEIKVLDKVLIYGEEMKLEKELYNNEDEIAMIGLRQVSEALGYKVEWNNETRTAELMKDAQWTSVTIGEDNYNFAKMIVKLGAVPELEDSTTFVPITFLEEVLRANVEITEEGIVSIVE